MRRSVVIIGGSPLSLLIARLLDRDVAHQADVEVTYLSREKPIIFWPELKSILGAHHFPDRAKLLNHINFKKTEVKQINLVDRRVITNNGLYEYDQLFLDLTPGFTLNEVEKISVQCRRLLLEIQAKNKTGHQVRSRVTFVGEDVASWQLALALAADLAAHPGAIQRSVAIQAQFPHWPALKDFLITNNVASRKTIGLLPGITIGAPTAVLKSKAIRGALLDDGENLLLTSDLNPEGHPECIVIQERDRLKSNLWRVDQTLAVRITDNIRRFLEGRRQLAIEIPKTAGLLQGESGVFAWLGRMESRGWRGRAMKALDRKFFQQITA